MLFCSIKQLSITKKSHQVYHYPALMLQLSTKLYKIVTFSK